MHCADREKCALHRTHGANKDDVHCADKEDVHCEESHSHGHCLSLSHSHSHTPIHEGGGASHHLHTGGAALRAGPPPVDFFMDGCVAVAVAKAVAEAVAEAVPVAVAVAVGKTILKFRRGG